MASLLILKDKNRTATYGSFKELIDRRILKGDFSTRFIKAKTTFGNAKEALLPVKDQFYLLCTLINEKKPVGLKYFNQLMEDDAIKLCDYNPYQADVDLEFFLQCTQYRLNGKKFPIPQKLSLLALAIIRRRTEREFIQSLLDADLQLNDTEESFIFTQYPEYQLQLAVYRAISKSYQVCFAKEASCWHKLGWRSHIEALFETNGSKAWELLINHLTKMAQSFTAYCTEGRLADSYVRQMDTTFLIPLFNLLENLLENVPGLSQEEKEKEIKYLYRAIMDPMNAIIIEKSNNENTRKSLQDLVNADLVNAIKDIKEKLEAYSIAGQEIRAGKEPLQKENRFPFRFFSPQPGASRAQDNILEEESFAYETSGESDYTSDGSMTPYRR
jgi:hypothetical protein